MTSTEHRRHELAEFLRSRRGRLTPEQVGLPTTGRRRTPGLRREELALIAGMSATWYTYLEQGRDIRVSDQVLEALAGALRLPPPERAHLMSLAGRPVAPGGHRPEHLAAGVAAMPRMLAPNPAYVTGANYDVLAWNDAAAEVFTDFAALPDPERNLVRWVLVEPAARTLFVDWEQVARGLLAKLRAAAGRHPDDPKFTRLVLELHELSPEVRIWWPRYDVAADRGGRKRLCLPGRGVVTLEHTVLQVAEAPDQQLVVYSTPGRGAPERVAGAGPDPGGARPAPFTGGRGPSSTG